MREILPRSMEEYVVHIYRKWTFIYETNLEGNLHSHNVYDMITYNMYDILSGYPFVCRVYQYLVYYVWRIVSHVEDVVRESAQPLGTLPQFCIHIGDASLE